MYQDEREQLINKAVRLIHEDTAIPLDLLAELDRYGVLLSDLFSEAASSVTRCDY